MAVSWMWKVMVVKRDSALPHVSEREAHLSARKESSNIFAASVAASRKVWRPFLWRLISIFQNRDLLAMTGEG